MNPLAALPAPATRRHAVRVTNDALRQIRAGHPWVFDRSIVSVDGVSGSSIGASDSANGASGDLAVIFDADRKFAAIGLYDPRSPIRIRVLHHGRPATIDRGWWSERLARAIERRRPVVTSGDTDGYRVVNGENDGFPGLVLDRYASTLVVKLYTAAWLPHLSTLVALMDDQLSPHAIVLRISREMSGRELFGLHEGMALVGAAPTGPIMFRENGLAFEADVIHGQKTGHFLDQRDNRSRVRALAKEARVVDVFSCTGGFSVYAAAGGASSVHSVDISGAALATGVRNLTHNDFIENVGRCTHTTEVGDAFDVMRKLAERRRKFEVVIVDPPSFARKQSERERALRAYGRLTRLALDLVADGGILVQSSCSSRISNDEFFAGIHATAGTTRHRLSEMVRTTHGVDHPITFPEGAYLKTLFARVSS
jgi:23S rRNA (cytosine1962-C5)-methyltransferase